MKMGAIEAVRLALAGKNQTQVAGLMGVSQVSVHRY